MNEALIAKLQCPACGGAFSRRENSLVCESGHCFDIARKGYVNLAPQRRADAVYGKALFESRRRVLHSGLYDPVAEALRFFCARFDAERTLLADAGCGEGFYAKHLAPLYENTVAFDLSREGVALAASGPKAPGSAFLVADLTRIPLKTGAVSTLLDVFTPAHYAEFARVLRPGGLLIKALPRPCYLREIRELTGQGEYKNDDVVRRMDEAGGGLFRLLAQETLTYTRPLAQELRPDALRMTPLTHGAAQADASLLTALTVDMEIVALMREEGA